MMQEANQQVDLLEREMELYLDSLPVFAQQVARTSVFARGPSSIHHQEEHLHFRQTHLLSKKEVQVFIPNSSGPDTEENQSSYTT